MKKLLSCGLLALLAVAATERPAQAWVNSKFSVGLSWHFQSANNNVLWGLFNNGPTPAFDMGYPSGYGVVSPSVGYGMGGYGLTATTPAVAAPTSAATPAAAPTTGAQTWNYNGYYANPYQTVGYNADAYYSGYYNAPSYWYGR